MRSRRGRYLLRVHLGADAAHEARIYWDAGAGMVDFSEPLGIVSLGHPTTAARYTWTSAAVTDDQEYRFVVRIATDARPAGVETQNTDDHVATADSDSPPAPILVLEVI
jgi:hypothetical protein